MSDLPPGRAEADGAGRDFRFAGRASSSRGTTLVGNGLAGGALRADGPGSGIMPRSCPSQASTHYRGPNLKSSKSVTLSAFVQTPTAPASLNVSSSTSKRLLPLN